jgi:glycosyl transferase family 25
MVYHPTSWPRYARNIFVINIRPKRKIKCSQHLGVLNRFIRGWVGVNGERLTSDDIKGHNPALTRGKIGCFMSHRKIWKKMVAEGIPHALILEDDCLWKNRRQTPLRLKKALQVLNTKHKNWDILLVGRNDSKRENEKLLGSNLAIPSDFWGMFAYIIKLKGAKKLLSKKGTKSFQVPSDVFLSRLGIQKKINLYAMVPCLATYNKKLRSDTRNIK